MRKFLSVLLVLVFAFSMSVHADDMDLAYKGLNELETFTGAAAAGDLDVVYDVSANQVKTVSAATGLTKSGDVTFQTTLLAVGRVNAASTAASSSTALSPSSLPYSILRKYIGGANSLDLTDGGTRLANGTQGQILILIAQEVATGGSWIVTPVTSLTITTLTFDAVAETTTLLYVDDTIGWVVMASSGTTIVNARQAGIPDMLG